MPDAHPYHFHDSAEDIRLEGWTLWAKLKRMDGSWNVAQLRLNYVLGNNSGKFTWGGVRVSSTAEGNPGLVFWEKYPIVRASLLDDHGKLHQADYNLSDTIGNYDGNFFFQFRGDRLVTTSNPDRFRWGIDYTRAVNGEIEDPALPL